MKLEMFILGQMQTKCYVMYDEKTLEGLIIDAGENIEQLIEFVLENKIKIQAVLITHGHFDHCFGAKKLQKLGYKICIHTLDADKLNTENNLASIVDKHIEYLNADFLLEQGDYKFGQFNVKVIHTPGHSKGSCVFVIDNYVFTGDTIFENGYGRTDFYDGSSMELRNSIRVLKPYINGSFQLFYGH